MKIIFFLMQQLIYLNMVIFSFNQSYANELQLDFSSIITEEQELELYKTGKFTDSQGRIWNATFISGEQFSLDMFQEGGSISWYLAKQIFTAEPYDRAWEHIVKEPKSIKSIQATALKTRYGYEDIFNSYMKFNDYLRDRLQIDLSEIEQGIQRGQKSKFTAHAKHRVAIFLNTYLHTFWTLGESVAGGSEVIRHSFEYLFQPAVDVLVLPVGALYARVLDGALFPSVLWLYNGVSWTVFTLIESEIPKEGNSSKWIKLEKPKNIAL